MDYIDKKEYEETYGEHVGYCRIHHIDVLGSCEYCDSDRLIECPWCHFTDYTDKQFTWADIDGEMELLCWGCTDKLHKVSMPIDLPSDIPNQNVDYMH